VTSRHKALSSELRMKPSPTLKAVVGNADMDVGSGQGATKGPIKSGNSYRTGPDPRVGFWERWNG